MRQALPQKQKLDFIDAPINPTTPRLFTVITTFAGCGGSSLGYKWAGGKVLAAVEWDENAVATYRLNHLGTPVLHRDITTVSADELLALTGLQPGELDIFDGSPPCQGFSTAGKRQIDDPRNSLFREYVRLLRGLQPKVFIMENVSGMVKGSMKHVFAIAMRELKASGYVVKCQLMDAAYFGVPQHRQRVIFIGVRNDMGIAPSHPRALGRATAFTPHSDIGDALVLTPEKWAMVKAHKQRHAAKGHGFGYQFHRYGEPMSTVTKEALLNHGMLIAYGTGARHPGIAELKEIASFPSAFAFAGGYAATFERIGNTVPPRFMQAIAEHVYSHILSEAPNGTTNEAHA